MARPILADLKFDAFHKTCFTLVVSFIFILFFYILKSDRNSIDACRADPFTWKPGFHYLYYLLYSSLTFVTIVSINKFLLSD